LLAFEGHKQKFYKGTRKVARKASVSEWFCNSTLAYERIFSATEMLQITIT